jgi:hypothetical protein
MPNSPGERHLVYRGINTMLASPITDSPIRYWKESPARAKSAPENPSFSLAGMRKLVRGEKSGQFPFRSPPSELLGDQTNRKISLRFMSQIPSSRSLPLPPKHCGDRFQKNLEVEGKVPILDVPAVQMNRFFKGRIFPRGDLPEASDAWFDVEPPQML